MSDTFQDILKKVREKKEAYRRYNFERLQEEAFATFFDLAQEYTHVENLYLACVAVPLEFFRLHSRLYMFDPKTSVLRLVCSSESGLVAEQVDATDRFTMAEKPYETDSSWVFPIRGNLDLSKWIPFHTHSRILGLFEIYPKQMVSERDQFFLEKFSNRIGYNLHQKLLIQQNIEHIKFINQLVADIEHNVISPNLYYKLFLIRLKRQIRNYENLKERIRELILFGESHSKTDCRDLCDIYREIARLNEALEEECQALSKHYEHTSLFLETLLRRDHFEKGTYVLRKQRCNFRSEIIQPLLERYLPIFEKQGIKVDHRLEEIPDEQVTLFVDKGLISQVFENLFSNAVKYTETVRDHKGHEIKLVSYSRKILKDYFGEGIHGVRFNFFSTGPTLSEAEAKRLYEEGFRGSNVEGIRGTGHGLHFVRNVVEIHGGEVGYEAQKYGNLFYFILPLKEEIQLTESLAGPGLQD